MLHVRGDLGKVGRGAVAAATAATAAAAVPGAVVLLGLVVTAPVAAPLTQVSIGIANTASDVGFFIADKKGYFRDQGIAVTMTPFASATRMIAPLGTGELDVDGGPVAAGLYNAVERGIRSALSPTRARSRTATNSRRCWCARAWSTLATTRALPTSRA